MPRKMKTIAISEETYMAILDFKKRTNSRTIDETIRKLIELSKQALVIEVLEHISQRKLTDEERRTLESIRAKLREEGVWLRRS
ncbi:MAG: hypothetical protein DRJ63_09065 [Thermoprotei archaeon]|nr:MAG: hypothetical protein DRJ63_09065 [Thermoprotei archaeon]